MNKKLVLTVFLAVLIICAGQVWAVQTVERVIASTTFQNATSSATGMTYVGDAQKVGFLLSYDETQTGNSVSATVTTQFSRDGTTFLAVPFYDFAGGATTFKTWGSISTDGSYYFWLDPDITIPQVKINVIGQQIDNNDTTVIDLYAIKDK